MAFFNFTDPFVVRYFENKLAFSALQSHYP